MKNATEVVTELYRKFPKMEFIDERDLGEDIVGLMFEYRNTETDEEQLKAYLDSIGNWYRIRESREFYGGKSLLVKAEDDYVSLPVEDDFGYSNYEDKQEQDYLLGEAVEGERAFMLRKGVLPDGTDSMLFIVSPSNRLCIVNGKEGMNDPTNTEPLYMQGEKSTIGGWEEELDKDTIVSLYLHQDGIVLDDADEEIDTEEDPEEGRFKRIASKSVQDSDGFYTDYTWYFDNEDRKHVFVFGDNDVYYPEDGYYDWEVEGDDEQAQAEAQEWFDSYNGFEEDDYNESLKEDIDEVVSLDNVAVELAKSGLTAFDIADNLMANYKADKDTAYRKAKDAYSYVRELGFFDESLKESSYLSDEDMQVWREVNKKLDSDFKEQLKSRYCGPGYYDSYYHNDWNGKNITSTDYFESEEDFYTHIDYWLQGTEEFRLVDIKKQVVESLEENVSDSESDWAMDNELKKTKLKTIDGDDPVYKSKEGKYFYLGSDDKYSGTSPEYCYDSEDPSSCEKQFKSGMWMNKRKFDKASGKYVKEDYCDMFGCESGFFTRDDLNELMDEINDRCPKGTQATGIYMSNDGRTLEVDMEDEDWGGDTIYKKIDMRKIRKPSDLLRYADSIITEFENTVSKWKES